MKKLFKRLAIVAVILILLVVGGVVLLFMNINSVVKKGIEQGGSLAMGVPTTVESVDLGLFSGTFGMKGFKIASPAGYTAPSFFTLGDTKVQVSAQSFSQDVIEVPTFSLSNIDVTLERKDSGFNYQVILDNLKKLSSGSGSTSTPAPSSGGGKEPKLIVNDLWIKNVTVHADLLNTGAAGKVLGDAGKLTIPIPEIHLQNVGKTGTGVGGTGVTVGQLSSIIVQAVLNAAAEKGGGILPADVLGDLQGRIASIGDLKGLPDKVVGDVKAKGEEAVKKAQDEGKKAIEGAGKALEGLIPGKK